MNRTPVKSSFIKAIGYDPALEQLEVEFSNGRIYQYADFPQTLWADMQTAESVGKFLNAVKSAHPSRRATELEEPTKDDGALPNMQDNEKR